MKKNPSKESLEEDGWDLKNIDSSSVTMEFEEVPELNWEDDESDNVELTPKEKDVIQELPLTIKDLNDREESGYNDIKKDKVQNDDKQIKIDSDFSDQNNENDQDRRIGKEDIDAKIEDSDTKDLNKIEKGINMTVNNICEKSDDTDLNFKSRKNMNSKHSYNELDIKKNNNMAEDELSINQSHKSSEFDVSLDVVSGVAKVLHLENVVDNKEMNEMKVQESDKSDDENRKELVAESEISLIQDKKLEILLEQKTTDKYKYIDYSSDIDEETCKSKENDNIKFELNKNYNGQDDLKNKHVTNELNAKVEEKMVEETDEKPDCYYENIYNKSPDCLITDTSLVELDNLQETQIEEENDEVDYESSLPQNKHIASSDFYINNNNENVGNFPHNNSDKNFSNDNTYLENCYEDKLIDNNKNENAQNIVTNKKYIYDKRIIHERFCGDEFIDNQDLTKCKLYNAELNNINKIINCPDVQVNENDIKQDDRLNTEGINVSSNGLNNARESIINDSKIEEDYNAKEYLKAIISCTDNSKFQCVTEKCEEPAQSIFSHKHTANNVDKRPEDLEEGISDNISDNKILMEDRNTTRSSENDNLLKGFEINHNNGEDIILKEINKSKTIQSNSKFENDEMDDCDLNKQQILQDSSRDDLDTVIKDVIIEGNESIDEKDAISKHNITAYNPKNKEVNKNNINYVSYNTNKELGEIEKKFNEEALRDDISINFGHEKHDRNTIDSYDNFKDENIFLDEINGMKNNTYENNHENIFNTLRNVENVDDIEDKHSSFMINHETSEEETIEESIWSSEEDDFLGTPDQDFKNFQDVSYKKIKNEETNIEIDKKLENNTLYDNYDDLNKNTNTLNLSGANYSEIVTKNTREKFLGDNNEGKNKFHVANNNEQELQKDDFDDIKNNIKTLDTNITYNKNQANKLNEKNHEVTEENVISDNVFMHKNESVNEQNNAKKTFVSKSINKSSINDLNTGRIFDKTDFMVNDQISNHVYVSKNDIIHDNYKGEPYFGNNKTLEFVDGEVHLEHNNDNNEIKEDTFVTCNEIERSNIVNSADPLVEELKHYDKDDNVYDENNNLKLVKSNSNENILPEDVWGDDPVEFEFLKNNKESKNNDEFYKGKIKIVLNEQNDPNTICHKDNSEQNIYDLCIVDQTPNLPEKLHDEISNLNLQVINENQTVFYEENHNRNKNIRSDNFKEQTHNQTDLEVSAEQKKFLIKENDKHLKKYLNNHFNNFNVNEATNKISDRNIKFNDVKIKNEIIKRNIFIPRIKKDNNNSDNNVINNEAKLQDTAKQPKDFVGDNIINIDKNKMTDKSVFIPQAAKNINIFKPSEKHTENSKDIYFNAFKNTDKNNRKICLVALKNSFLITYPINQKRMDAKLQQEIEVIKYTHSFYASGDEKIISTKRKENKFEENLMNLINMNDLEFNKVIKETINFEVKVKNGDYKHNFKLDEQKFYDYYFSNTDYAIKRSIENNNWLLSFLFSWNDLVYREKVLVQFLNTFYHPETAGILMLKMGINNLKNLKNIQNNWKEYFLLSLQNYNKNFINKLISIIGEYNIHNALFCYIVVKRKLGDDLDILGLFNNNIFAIELLTSLEEKYEKVKDLDVLLYHYILAVQSFNNDQAYKLYKKKKSRLRKEFVDVFDNLFVDKKWGFGGLRSVVDRGISRMIGIEVKEDVKKTDINNNKKNREILKKCEIRNDTETNMKSEKYFIPEVNVVNNDLRNHKSNNDDVNTHAQSKNLNTKEENSSNHNNNNRIHYTRAVDNTEIMSRKFISTDDKVSDNMIENGAAIKDLVNKGPEPVNRASLFIRKKESKINLHEKELKDQIYINENKAIIDKVYDDVKIKNAKHKLLKPLDSNFDKKYNNETEYSICNNLPINNKYKTDLKENVESCIIDSKTNIDQGINHVNVENNINQNESINKKEVMLKDVNNDLDKRFEDINENKTNDSLKNDQIKKNRIKTYGYYNNETIQNDGELYNEYESTINHYNNKDSDDINKIGITDNLLSEQESSINTNSIINDTIQTRGGYNEFGELNLIQNGDINESSINLKSNTKHGFDKIKKNCQEDCIDISQNNVFIEYNKNNIKYYENKNNEYVENIKRPENKKDIDNKNILNFENKNSIVNKNIFTPENNSDMYDKNILMPGEKTKLHDKTSVDNKNIFTPNHKSSMHDKNILLPGEKTKLHDKTSIDNKNIFTPNHKSIMHDENRLALENEKEFYDNSENITDALISKIENNYNVNDENLIFNNEFNSNQDFNSNDKIGNDLNTNNEASELSYNTNVIINNANAPAEFCRSFYKQTRHTQSFADIFSQTENSTSENTTRDDTSILLKSFINEEKEEEKKDKKEEKKEEKEEEKKSFFNFSRFFGAKKKVYKVNIESDAAFIYDPVTKKWINKNENKESKFKATEEKKEIAMPKIINKPLVKGKRGTLEGRYAGYKTGTKNELQTFIPGLKRQKENEEK